MEPKKVGRALGIGVRVASNMVRQRIADASQASPAAAPQSRPEPYRTPSHPPAATFAYPRANASPGQAKKAPGTRGAAMQRGLRAFTQAIVGPFSHAGGVLWLEITGMFFALFALFFMQNVYRVRSSWRMGPDHTHFVLYALLAAVFCWFSI